MTHKRTKRNFDRGERIADLIQKSLAQIIRQEMSDQRFQFVSITSVVVSRDMAYAKVYVSLLDEEQEKIKDIINALNRAAKNLRYRLAQAVELRVIPELKFIYDESSAHGFKISKLINTALKNSPEE